MSERDKLVNAVAECMRLQDMFNKKVNPNWQKAGYPFYRAAWLEMAEAVGPTNWKWWKKQEDDRYQTKLEMVDIFHFALSELIIKGTQPSSIVSTWESTKQRFPAGKVNDIEYTLEQAEGFIEIATGMREQNIQFFFKTMLSLDISIEDVLKLYVSKNVLNIFRQDNGYKEGTYIKTWFGEEDNKFLENIVSESAELTYDGLYSALSAKYAQVIENSTK